MTATRSSSGCASRRNPTASSRAFGSDRQRGSGAIEVCAVVDRAGADARRTRAAEHTRIGAAGPYTFFGSAVPATASADDSDPVELGLRFTPESDGFVIPARSKFALSSIARARMLAAPEPRSTPE
jgi:hypothetical protein